MYVISQTHFRNHWKFCPKLELKFNQLFLLNFLNGFFVFHIMDPDPTHLSILCPFNPPPSKKISKLKSKTEKIKQKPKQTKKRREKNHLGVEAVVWPSESQSAPFSPYIFTCVYCKGVWEWGGGHISLTHATTWHMREGEFSCSRAQRTSLPAPPSTGSALLFA